MIGQEDLAVAILFQKFDSVARGDGAVIGFEDDAQIVSTVDELVEVLRAQDPDPEHTEFDLSVDELKADLPALQV